MGRKFAVFIDRDGVVNEDHGYFHEIEKLTIFPKVGEAIRLLNENNIPAIVVTNQSVVARGLITEKDLHKIHSKIADSIYRVKARIDKFYYCPHHPEANIEKYRMICSCRKPETGMFTRAAYEFDLDINNSWVVGDSYREIEAARKLKCKSIAVKCGSSDFRRSFADYTFHDLYEAVTFILKKSK